MSRQQGRKRTQQSYRRNKKNQSRMHAMWLVVVIILALGGYLKKDVVWQQLGDAGKILETVAEKTSPETSPGQQNKESSEASSGKQNKTVEPVLEKIPDFSGEPYITLNNNVPLFSKKERTTKVFERYSELDSLGRCGVAYANICKKLMPTEQRKAIGPVKPSGWHTIKYDCVDGKYLYNRCHLIGFQLAGENANEKNLITGTRYLNVDGMLPFENEVADYVKETNHHVLYRVTPYFEGDDLVAKGVQMEAYSVEDKGKGVCFHVFVYNSQPGVTIDYATGDSHLTKTKK